MAHAGATGNQKAFVAAKEVENAQVRIADKIKELVIHKENTLLHIDYGNIVIDSKEKKDYKKI